MEAVSDRESRAGTSPAGQSDATTGQGRSGVLPTGTVTFLFTDIEGSTRLLTRLGAAYDELLARHHALMRAAISSAGGVEVGTDGDAFFLVFTSALNAARGAADAQRALAAEPWPDDGVVRVRMGLHTGEGRLAADDYVGIDVHRAARIAAAAHGGEVLVSGSTQTLLEGSLPAGTALRDLGEHRLKDLPRPERLHQLVISGLPSDFPPPRSLDAVPGDLPEPLTSFVGRESEIEAISDLLVSSRMVTLTGPGGTGKTRLSIEVARRVRDRFPDGAWFVPLEAVRDPDLVLPTIARVLGVREEPNRDAGETLVDRLGARPSLLVLDNLEQVVVVGPRLRGLLESTEAVRILATSREVLRVSGEQEYQVPPLAADPAMQLFLERARLARPDFTLDERGADAVQRLCERLDRLPLSIELVAARVRLFSPEAILARLDKRLPLLSGGGRDLPDRQRTLRGAIDWSFQLLDREEQHFFAQLAVFAGPVDLEAIEQIVDPDGELGPGSIDAVQSLVEKSLLRELPSAAGEPRFGMLETIREFAAERLAEEPQSDALRERHARYYLELAERLEPELMGRDPGPHSCASVQLTMSSRRPCSGRPQPESQRSGSGSVPRSGVTGCNGVTLPKVARA
jgi:predicted ATPase/class 3 adenylate cyclase